MPVKILSGAAFALLAVAGIAFSIPSTEGGCTLTNARPCYDKIKGGSISILKKNAENAFSACVSNSAPNETGTASLMTAECPNEEATYAYCFEGKSRIYMRKFTGNCPIPEPEPEPEPVPGPVAFRILTPNGGEVLPFGSSFPIKWEGGNPEWSVNLSIDDGTQVKRRLVWHPANVSNDGVEDWVVDLPPGKYRMYAEGCKDETCTTKEWDYSDSLFEVVDGSPLARITSGYPANQSIVVLSPSATGISWQASTTHEIIWSGGTASSKIQVALIDLANNVVHSTIATDTENDGKYTWTIPATVASGQYKIAVQCTDCAQVSSTYYNYSFNPFSITAP